MKKIILIFIVCVISYTLYVTKSFAQQPAVVINEFQIEPSPQVVELFNKGTESVDISNWYIDDSGGTTYFTIPQGNILYPNACLSFSADFNLNKTSSDTIRLFDNTAQPSSSLAALLDSFSYKASSGSAITYQRLPDGQDIWATGPASFNLFNLNGNSCLILPTSTPTPTQEPTVIPTTTSTPTPTISQQISYDNIYISEVMVDPNTGEKEWIEIYNGNDFTVILVDWYIDDLENAGSSPKLFSLEIPTKSYSTFELASSIFNNDGDSVRLLDFNKLEKDSFEYDSSEKGKSLGRGDFEDDNVCIQEPSKGFSNFPCLNPNSTESVELGQIYSKSLNPTMVAKKTSTSTLAINSPTSTAYSFTQEGEVLGTTSVNRVTMKQSNNLSRAFSFVSFSYSILTLMTILLKMRIGV